MAGYEPRRGLYIFDLDGTLANIDHRKHILEQTDNPNRWREFYSLCDKDTPNYAVMKTLHMLWSTGADIWFFSGRSDEVREKTVQWIEKYTYFRSGALDTILMMRCAGDFTPDDKLKEQWLKNMLLVDRNRLIAVFDDRTKVVKMWRRNGVPCFQVADGEF